MAHKVKRFSPILVIQVKEHREQVMVSVRCGDDDFHKDIITAIIISINNSIPNIFNGSFHMSYPFFISSLYHG